MIAILHYYNKTAYVHRLKNVSVNDDGFCCEPYDTGRTPQIVAELQAKGFKASQLGALIHTDLTGFTIIPEEKTEE